MIWQHGFGIPGIPGQRKKKQKQKQKNIKSIILQENPLLNFHPESIWICYLWCNYQMYFIIVYGSKMQNVVLVSPKGVTHTQPFFSSVRSLLCVHT